MNYCCNCGSRVERKVPEGDNNERYVCACCNTIHYENPRVIVGCIPAEGNRVLLCKRAIEPRPGKWTLPGGFLENGESVEEGAVRETKEEANATVANARLFSLYSVPDIGQLYVFFLADLDGSGFSSTPESLEVGLFSEEEIPWKDLAFPSVEFTLKRYFGQVKTGGRTVFNGTYMSGSP